MALNTLPMIGPSNIKTAMTTMATRTRINAYSTKPWPFSFGANIMGITSFLRDYVQTPCLHDGENEKWLQYSYRRVLFQSATTYPVTINLKQDPSLNTGQVLFTGQMNLGDQPTDERLLLMVLNTLPIIGPSNIRTAITTMATRTRIKAYSTKPCPFSFGANNIDLTSFPKYTYAIRMVVICNKKLRLRLS